VAAHNKRKLPDKQMKNVSILCIPTVIVNVIAEDERDYQLEESHILEML
jgi:hypothetical protein